MDKINPEHYKSHPSGVECIEIAQHHDFLIGNAIKYLWRAGLKNEATEVEDLKKAVWYIERKIKVLEAQGADGIINIEPAFAEKIGLRSDIENAVNDSVDLKGNVKYNP